LREGYSQESKNIYDLISTVIASSNRADIT